MIQADQLDDADRGKPVRVTFWDHVRGSATPVKVELYGKLMELHPRHLLISPWSYPEDTNADSSEDDYAIILSTVIGIDEMVVAPL